MRRALVVALCLGATAAAAGDEDRAFVDVSATRDTYFVGEPIRLRLRFGVDADFFRDAAIQLFQRPLDVPVQVEAPWIRGLPGTVALADAAPSGGGTRLTFALNDGTSEAARVADTVRGGRAFTVGEIERALTPDRPGDVTVAAATLRYAFATRFDDSDLRGRVAVDRHEALVTGRPLTLRVLALPDAGRPPGFAGAVGHFTVRAETAARDAVVGEPFKLTLHIEGEGNLETLAAPRLDDLAGFHVFGAIDDHARVLRTITYDVAALRDDVRAVPAIAFAYFDTTPPAQYRVAETPPIPLAVRPSPHAPAGAAGAESRDAATTRLLVLVAILAAAAALVAFVRRRAAARPPPVSPVRSAAQTLRADVLSGDPANAFAAFLGACLGVPAAAVIAPDLAARLASADIPAGVATRAATLLDALVAARYGGGPATGDERAAVVALAVEIEAALDAGRRG